MVPLTRAALRHFAEVSRVDRSWRRGSPHTHGNVNPKYRESRRQNGRLLRLLLVFVRPSRIFRDRRIHFLVGDRFIGVDNDWSIAHDCQP